MKKFIVKIYFTTYCSFEIEANNEEEAILKARRIKVNNDELIMNLENWEEADESFEIENTENTQ